MATITKPLRWATVDAGVASGAMSKCVLTDGEKFYCNECDYTATKYGSVRAHHQVHSTKSRKGRGPAAKTVAAADKNIEQALALIVEAVNEIQQSLSAPNGRAALVGAKQLENVTRQRDEAVARAKAAEKKFNTLKNLFQD